ncbi:hypothetical protein EW145_g1233 [Phellinidium pouzarii]|uniref:Uncharacterized protein n=1 Tax=Phellinidium pouzarii TaxID=167371 RepID=A0A4S4LFV7_9AGAM|nr:hypothetical protein EW145_g1233 [Phellinidium pouzarii]
MSGFPKSYSSRRAFLPYLKSASSKLNISALGSTSSLSAFFSSTNIRGIISGREKENALPTRPKAKSTTPSDKSKKQSAYPEISAPQLSPEGLAAVKARFTLIPLAKLDREADMNSDGEPNALEEDSFEHIESATVQLA